MDPSPQGGLGPENVDHSSSKFLEVFYYFFIISSDSGQWLLSQLVWGGFSWEKIVALGKNIVA